MEYRVRREVHVEERILNSNNQAVVYDIVAITGKRYLQGKIQYEVIQEHLPR